MIEPACCCCCWPAAAAAATAAAALRSACSTLPWPSGVSGTCRRCCGGARGGWRGRADGAAAAAAAPDVPAPPRPLLAMATAAAARLLPAPAPATGGLLLPAPATGGRLLASCRPLSLAAFCSREGGILERTCSSYILVLLCLQEKGGVGTWCGYASRRRVGWKEWVCEMTGRGKLGKVRCGEVWPAGMQARHMAKRGTRVVGKARAWANVRAGESRAPEICCPEECVAGLHSSNCPMICAHRSLT